MIRFTKAIAVAAVALMLPTVASALGISIVTAIESGAQDRIIEVGESIQFDLRLENDGNEILTGLDVIAFGYDETASTAPTISSGLTNTGGAVVSSVFLQAPGAGFTGLGPNIVSEPTDLFNVNNLNPEFVRTQLFGGLLIAGTPADTTNDTGIAGIPISDGDVHFRVTFTNIPTQIGVSNIDIQFGTDEGLGAIAVGFNGETLTFYNDSLNLTVIPEPGTALLMGLGLAGLASTRRR